MNKWQAIVFDLDDTLYSEADYVLSGFNAVANWAAINFNIPVEQGFAELKALFDAGIRGTIINRWLSSHNISHEHLPLLIETYRSHAPAITPFAEVPALLTTLKTNYKLGIVSDGYLQVQTEKLRSLNLANYFDAVLFSDELGREYWKPSIRPFERIAELLKVELNRAIYIGDNPTKDFYGARKAGFFTIRLQRTHGEYASLVAPTPAHESDLIIHQLTDLLNVLE